MPRTSARLLVIVSILVLSSLTMQAAFAGNAHFVGTPKVTRAGNTVTVSGKVAGLGNIPDIFVEVQAQAACLNRGENFPEADNKESFSSAGTFPVQNGRANFAQSLTATFQPRCSPPMTVVFGPVTINIYDAEPPGGDLLLSRTFAGPF